MKKTLMIAMASLCLSAKGQMQLPKNFVYLNNDSVVSAKRITLKANTFNRLYLYTGESRIPAEQVKFFQNQHGFFANIRQLNYTSQNEFVERVTEGKINLYDRLIYDPYLERRRGAIAYNRPYPVAETTYFNKGFGDIKRMNYNNLKFELKDNQQSMDLLAAYQRKKRTSTILYATGATSILISFLTFFAGANKEMKSMDARSFGSVSRDSNYTGGYILLGTGAVLSTIGALNSLRAKDNLINAVEIYNR